MIIIVCLSKKHTYLKKNCDIEWYYKKIM
jgi:hypothetical protein